MGAGIGEVIVIDLIIPFPVPVIGGYVANYIERGDTLNAGKAGFLPGFWGQSSSPLLSLQGRYHIRLLYTFTRLAPGFSCISSLPCTWLFLLLCAVQLQGLSGNRFSFRFFKKTWILTPLYRGMKGNCHKTYDFSGPALNSRHTFDFMSWIAQRAFPFSDRLKNGHPVNSSPWYPASR